MSNIKVLIVEDDPLYALELKMLIEELEYELINVVDNSDDVFEVIKKDQPDLILMDIKIKGKLNGIQLAEKLQEENEIAVIFITSFDDRKFYDEAKVTTHFGYLVKPINKLTLESTIEVAVMAHTDSEKETTNFDVEKIQEWDEDMILRNCVFIKRKNKLEKVLIDKIEFIQSEGNYCVISTERKKYALKMSLIKVMKLLKAHPFARVNKRHIINMSLITSIDLSTNQINTINANFAIGRTYKENLLKRLKTLS